MKEIKLSNFNPFTVFMDLLYNFWVIVLAAIIGFVSVNSYYDFAYEPRYKSSMTVCVNVKDSNGYVSSNITKTIEIAGVMQNMFSNNVMDEFVAEHAVDFVAAKVSASVIEETNLVVITAESKSAVDAFKTLKAVFENYKTIFAENVFQDVYINIVTEPTVASAPYNTVEPRQKEIMGAFALALAVALLIVAVSFLRDTVKQESDMENYVDGEFFAVVYHEKASKETIALAKKNKTPILQSVADPFCSYVFSQCISTIATRVEYLKKTKDCKSFIFTSVDEHEGKTTISVNTALSLASKGYRTLLIDADLRRPSVYRHFPNEDEEMKYGELGDKLLGKETDNLIHYDEKTGLYFIAGKNSYKYAFELLGSEKFKELLDELYIGFDFIIIDTPPTLLTADAEAIADSVDAS
ncbi:MAG: AAA family ATPase, partial [Acutalibacteraceae bacterium]